MADGVLSDLDEDDAPYLAFRERRIWLIDHAEQLLFDSTAVLARSSTCIPWFESGGIYFLIWRDRICYVGKSTCIGNRLEAHLKEGRPVERVAVILGIPTWAQNEVEYAYIHAWETPWNSETKRCGTLHRIPEFVTAANTLDKSCVMPWFTPTLDRPWPRAKAWQLHVLGVQQAHAKTLT